MYCGDEKGSFISNIGYSKSHFDYSSKDCPKVGGRMSLFIFLTKWMLIIF